MQTIGVLYIEETVRRLVDRILEHIRSVLLRTSDLCITAHVNNGGHFMTRFSHCITAHHDSTLLRKRREQRFIYLKNGTISMAGLKEEFYRLFPPSYASS